MNLWQSYKAALNDILPDLKFGSEWASWEGKGTTLSAKTYTHPSLIKSREVDISSNNSSIYNNILYPKTGSNLPCFGMDLMAFNEKRVIVVFDFQHPVENHLLSFDDLPKAEKEYRFFEMGNHFSENIFVRYCKMEEVDAYLSDIKTYLTKYRDMLELEKPVGTDTNVYKDFDAYMTRLDPVGGYLASKFGADKADRLVNDFLFEYG